MLSEQLHSSSQHFDHQLHTPPRTTIGSTLLTELQNNGIVIKGHFAHRSGGHFQYYASWEYLWLNHGLATSYAYQLVEPYIGKIDVIAGPASGGLLLANLALVHMEPKHSKNIVPIWLDKTSDGSFSVRSEFLQLLAGARVLIVDDGLTTGRTTNEVRRVLVGNGATVVGIRCIIDRWGTEPHHAPHTSSLIQITPYDPKTCPLCLACVPIAKNLNAGPELHKTFPDYPGGYVTVQPVGIDMCTLIC